MNKTLVYGGILIAILLAVGAYFFPSVAGDAVESLGSYGTRFQNGLCVGSTCSVTRYKMTIGNSADAIGKLFNKTGSSYPLIMPKSAGYTQAATTTYGYDVAVTGIVSGCTVMATYATSTPTLAGAQWPILGAIASTTAGYATLVIENLTGTAANPSVTGIASSTSLLVACP